MGLDTWLAGLASRFIFVLCDWCSCLHFCSDSFKKELNSKIPFGTFLTLATFATIIFGDSLINFYLSLI